MTQPLPQRRRVRLGLELMVLFVGLPLVLALLAPGRPVLPVLWLAAVWCGWNLRKHGRKETATAATVRPTACVHTWARILLRWTVGAGLLTGALALWRPDQLFILPRVRPALWLAIVLLYPWFSVVPQTIVYRGFFYHRYQALFPTVALADMTAAVLFSWGHIVFLNLWAVLWTLPAGWLFARTYRKTGSLALSALEHALYGDAIFTIGWGAWFFHGTQAMASAVTGLAPP